MSPRPQVPDKAKHYGISTVLKEAVDPAKDLVLQVCLGNRCWVGFGAAAGCWALVQQLGAEGGG